MKRKIKIERVFQKEGVSQKTGRPWKMYSFAAEGTWYSSFDDRASKWREGDVVEFECELSDFKAKDGKERYDIVFPKITMADIMEKLEKIEKMLLSFVGREVEEIDEEEEAEEIPF